MASSTVTRRRPRSTSPKPAAKLSSPGLITPPDSPSNPVQIFQPRTGPPLPTRLKSLPAKTPSPTRPRRARGFTGCIFNRGTVNRPKIQILELDVGVLLYTLLWIRPTRPKAGKHWVSLLSSRPKPVPKVLFIQILTILIPQTARSPTLSNSPLLWASAPVKDLLQVTKKGHGGNTAVIIVP